MKVIKKILMITIVAGFCASFCIAETSTGPLMAADSTVYDFGDIKQNMKLNFHFSFLNEGDTALEIKQYQTYCDCTTIEEVPDSIPPGEKGVIKGFFNSKDYKGEVERMITVVTNEKTNETHVLLLKAHVTELIKIDPENTMMFPHEEKDGLISKEIVVQSTDGSLFKIKEIKSKVAFLTGSVIIEEEEKEEKEGKKKENKKEKEKLKSQYRIRTVVDRKKVPDFGFFYIAVELAVDVEFKEKEKGSVEQKTMFLIFNDQLTNNKNE